MITKTTTDGETISWMDLLDLTVLSRLRRFFLVSTIGWFVWNFLLDWGSLSWLTAFSFVVVGWMIKNSLTLHEIEIKTYFELFGRNG